MQSHGFCRIHRIAYNRDFDYTCPQCVLAHVASSDQQLDYDANAQRPLDASGAPLDAKTLQPVK